MTTHITDEEIQAVAATARPYSVALLSWTTDRHQEGADAIELEHQRRMVAMRADRTIAILCPVQTDDLAGIAIMTFPVKEATAIMAQDPCVQAGMMTVAVHPCASFPGDSLPA
ncbi:MAG: hypothetical protein ABIR34_06095 [Marmoricola sp.]